MSAEANKDVIRRYREAHNANDMAALDQLVAADIITHSQLPGVSAGLEGGKQAHAAFQAAFPDLQTTTDDLIAEGDRVVERFTVHGTQNGPFLGAPPSGKSFTATGMSIFRIENGVIVEHWGENDTMSVLQQLGMMPAPEMPA